MLITSFHLQCFVADGASQEWLTKWMEYELQCAEKHGHDSVYLKLFGRFARYVHSHSDTFLLNLTVQTIRRL